MIVDRVKLRKLKNTRDLGGMKGADGRAIKRGKLIRSGALSGIPPATASALKERGVTTVVDLRIENERSAHPDAEIEGSRYIHLPILCVPTIGVTGDGRLFDSSQKERARVKKEGERIKREFGSIDAYMTEVYRSIVFSPEGEEGLARFLALVKEEEGCLLFHCMSGKDRAGICAMLVESLLGVDEKTIFEDYMLSGKFLRKKYNVNKAALVLVPTSMRLKRILFGLMRTKREYLARVMDEMKQNYGSVIGYCRERLHVTDEDVAFLREKYLEKP